MLSTVTQPKLMAMWIQVWVQSINEKHIDIAVKFYFKGINI